MALEIYDPFDYATQEDPYAVYRELRDRHPIYHNKTFNFWALSRYDDCAAAARNFRVFTSAYGTTLEPVEGLAPTVINTDPPVHTRLRHLIAERFTPARVQPLEARVRAYAKRLLEPVKDRGRFDIIADFAAKLPMAIICGMLGFPENDEDMLRNWTDQCVHREEGVFEMPEAGMQATRDLYGYFAKELEDRKRRPRDDIVQALVDAQAKGTLSYDEVLGYLYILSIAGNETTTKLIGNLAWQFNDCPEALRRVRGNRGLLPQAIEECLRIDGPTHMMARTTTEDVHLHGTTIPAKAKVALLFICANRDERKYANPDRYDLDRNPRDHLAFGAGLHACMGAALARMEARVAWEELLTFMGEFSVDIGKAKRMHSPQVRGFTHLPLEFSRAA